METSSKDSLIVQKTQELCQTLVEQPEFIEIRQRIDAFMSDEAAKTLYQAVMEKGDELQHKQQMGVPLDEKEITAFEKNREQLLNLPVARGFLDAQQQMHKIQESVMQFVGKTFELGRVPASEDFPAEGCGSGCGCH